MSVVSYDKLKETVSYAFVKVNDDNVNVVVVGRAKRGRISTQRNKRNEKSIRASFMLPRALTLQQQVLARCVESRVFSFALSHYHDHELKPRD